MPVLQKRLRILMTLMLGHHVLALAGALHRIF
jgi:hypothetical protein